MIYPQKSPATTARILAQTQAIRKRMSEMSAPGILRADSFVDIPGLLFEHEGYTIQELASGRNVLEIGAYMGRSSIALAYSANRVTSVEHFNGDTMADRVLSMNYHRHVLNSGASGKTALIEADFFEIYGQGRIDLLAYDMWWYDANHAPPLPYELDFFKIILDLYKAPRMPQNERKPQVRILAVHDYKEAETAFKATVEACSWFTQESGVPMQGGPEHGSVRWWELEI